MTDTDATIQVYNSESPSHNYTFSFRAVDNFKVKKSQPVIPVPFISTTPASTILFRFFGQTEEVTFNFVLFNDDTDVSGGTYGSTVKTVNEQILYLKNHIYTDEFDTIWKFISQFRYYSSTVDVVITNLDIDSKAGNVAAVSGSISLMRGTIANL